MNTAVAPEVELWKCRRCRVVLVRDQCATRFGILECGTCMNQGGWVDQLERYSPPAVPVPAPPAAVPAQVAGILPDSLSEEDRRYKLWRVGAELFGGALAIRQGKTRDVYAVAEVVPELPGPDRVFHLVKCTGTRSEFGPYHVRVPRSRGEVGECSCTGFGRWGNCKHLDTLTDLVQEVNTPTI